MPGIADDYIKFFCILISLLEPERLNMSPDRLSKMKKVSMKLCICEMLRHSIYSGSFEIYLLYLGFRLTLSSFIEGNISRYITSFFCLAIQIINGMVTVSLTKAWMCIVGIQLEPSRIMFRHKTNLWSSTAMFSSVSSAINSNSGFSILESLISIRSKIFVMPPHNTEMI